MTKAEVCEALERAARRLASYPNDLQDKCDLVLLRTLKQRIERGVEEETGIYKPARVLHIDWSGREGEAG